MSSKPIILLSLYFFVQMLLICQPSFAENCRRLVTQKGSSHQKLEPERIFLDRSNELESVLFKDPIEGFFAKGTVVNQNNQNILSLVVITKKPNSVERPQILRGKKVIPKIIEEFEAYGIPIDGIASYWVDKLRGYDAQPSDNYLQFLRAYKKATVSKGILKLPEDIDKNLSRPLQYTLVQSIVEAAQTTWTGQRMKELGFEGISKIQIENVVGEVGFDGTKDGSVRVQIIWTKKRIPIAKISWIHIKTTQSGREYLGSALPRLHELASKISE
jgi:hypothetical protein